MVARNPKPDLLRRCHIRISPIFLKLTFLLKKIQLLSKIIFYIIHVYIYVYVYVCGRDVKDRYHTSQPNASGETRHNSKILIRMKSSNTWDTFGWCPVGATSEPDLPLEIL